MIDAANGQKRGVCPGVWTPMASGDGWLIRLRTGARALGSQQVSTLAGLAATYGSGLIELTRRGNLQLRGLRAEGIASLQAELVALGLADPLPAQEQRPALLVDALAALENGGAAVTDPASAIDAALVANPWVRELSPKFAIAIDAGSGVLSGVGADIRVEVQLAATHARVLIDTPAGPVVLGFCRGLDLIELVTLLLEEVASFSIECGEPARMRDYVRVRGIQGLHARVDRLLIAAPRFQAHASKTPILIGHHAGRPGWFGLGVPFGSAPHSTWSVVADLAERFGQAAIRLTPARVILLPGVSARAAAMLTDLAEQCGLITREQDPRRRVIACAGAPACASACGETRVLATSLAAQLRERLIAGATLHVSGCGKACASDAAAAVTLVLAEGGAQLGFDADVAAARAQPIEPLARACDRILAQCVQGSVTADEGTAAALATPLDAKGALA